jgi:hypothetical protein
MLKFFLSKKCLSSKSPPKKYFARFLEITYFYNYVTKTVLSFLPKQQINGKRGLGNEKKELHLEIVRKHSQIYNHDICSPSFC